MALTESFSQENTQSLNLVSDLVGLGLATTKLASFFYNADHQPKPNVAYRPDLRAFNDLNWTPVTDQMGNQKESFLNIRGGKNWLETHGVVSVAYYTGGNSASVYALRLENNHIKMLRTSFKNPNRIVSPMVLQPQAKNFDLFGKRFWNDTYTDVFLEILPAVPVLPNDIAGIEPISGHSTYRPTPLLPSVISPNDWSRLEGQKLALGTVFGSQGFTINRIADMGVLPDGTIVFVDPDVLQEGNRRIDIASARVHNLIGQLDPGIDMLECYKWRDHNCLRSNNIMAGNKQSRFFPNPYTTSIQKTPIVHPQSNLDATR